MAYDCVYGTPPTVLKAGVAATAQQIFKSLDANDDPTVRTQIDTNERCAVHGGHQFMINPTSVT
jgi:hypothetical protein